MGSQSKDLLQTKVLSVKWPPAARAWGGGTLTAYHGNQLALPGHSLWEQNPGLYLPAYIVTWTPYQCAKDPARRGPL